MDKGTTMANGMTNRVLKRPCFEKLTLKIIGVFA
jgi:hypothetical protein